jgi:pimeloyl-ACP methyl ester carboxylesterase
MHRHAYLAAITWLLCSSCFSRFVMTEKELRNYYKDGPEKPLFFTIHNDSVDLFCATSGADTLPPLLLIHGAPGAWYGSRNFLEDSVLKQHFHIIAVDRLGYNKSRFKGSRRAVTSFTTQATAIHEALRLNKSNKTGIIAGSSYGAPIALRFVTLYPGSFHHLVLLAGAIDPDKEKFWWFSPYAREAPVRWFLPRFLNVATAEKYTHVEELRKLLPDWEKITIPVTVVQGGADNIVDPANLEFARKQLAGKKAEFIFIPDAGHLIRWRNAGVVRSIFLRAGSGEQDTGKKEF